MNQTVVIIGIGEMGGVFAKGFLRSGYPVYPNHKCVGRSDG
jgi:prephenate dehydrogenase